MFEGGSGRFSVVYFDGENTINVGQVTVDSALNFKNFQTDISQKIGISPHQLSVYLASPESNRKIPITGRANFAAIARQKGGFFFVKRSKRSGRRHKTHKEMRNDERYSVKKVVEQPNKKIPPANVMLLRRNGDIDNLNLNLPPFTGFKAPILDRIDYGQRMRNLHIERERYLMNMQFGSLCLEEESNGGCEVNAANGGGEKNANGGQLVCEVCSIANGTGRDVDFHWCVNDAVIKGFRSTAGPIARPAMKSG